jgi:ribosomal protein L25 (general stress protein Ctc)
MFFGRRNFLAPRSYMSLIGRSFSENVEATASGITAPLLQGVLRKPNMMGSRLSRYMRRDLGQLPGIIYGVDEIFPLSEEEISDKESAQNQAGEHKQFRYESRSVRIPIQVDIKAVEKELARIGRHFESTVYELMLDDNSRHFVFPRQVQINPCKLMFMHNI